MMTMHTFLPYQEKWVLVSIGLSADEFSQLLHLERAICKAAVQATYTLCVRELVNSSFDDTYLWQPRYSVHAAVHAQRQSRNK